METAGELPPNVTASHLTDMPLVNAGRNKYRILGEMGWMADRRGRPIEIDFDKLPVQPVTTAALSPTDIKMPVKT
ncbi:hypothetical protein, partial [Pseudomonas marginalis]|uniref:hypothetical protein n=1 Tax=Pseudomonas marginalis TaxID=298 RepID=UPI0034D59A9E